MAKTIHCLDDIYKTDENGKRYRDIMCGAKGVTYIYKHEWKEYKGCKCKKCEAAFQTWLQELKQNIKAHEEECKKLDMSDKDFNNVLTMCGMKG